MLGHARTPRSYMELVTETLSSRDVDPNLDGTWRLRIQRPTFERP